MDNTSFKVVERITGALSLIGLGVIFILNTTGVVPWGVWGYMISIVFSIWPIFLIIAGINIIAGNSNISKIALNLLWFLFISVFWLFVILTYPESKIYNLSIQNFFNISNESRVEDTKEINISEYSEDLDSINYEYSITAGEVNINDDISINEYITLNSKYYNNHGTPKLEADENEDLLKISLSQEFSNRWLWFGREGLEYSSKINNNELETSIDLNLTAGRANIDLDEISVDSLNVNMTAGSVNFDLSEEGNLKTLNIDITAGDFNLNLDKEYKVIVTNDSTAGTTNFNNIKLKEGRSVFNTSSINELVINISQTAGNVNIKSI